MLDRAVLCDFFFEGFDFRTEYENLAGDHAGNSLVNLLLNCLVLWLEVEKWNDWIRAH